MANYVEDNIDQIVFLDVDYLKVLGERTFERCLYELLTHHVDLTVFDAAYKNKKVGRKAYPPAMLLRIIFYAYYRGINSSRRIAESCETDLKFMALAAGKRPHFTTIADFVSGHTEAMNEVFHKVLMICCRSGLVGKEHFAIDGCKLPSDASKQWSGTHKDLRKKSGKLKKSAQKIIDKHLSNDNTKDGNDSDQGRRRQTVETLLKNAEKIDTFLAENEPKMGVGKRKKEVQSNITDPDSTKMTTSNGVKQGYNCQTVSDEKHQVIVATECFGIGQDQSLLKPMVEKIKESLGEDIFDDGALLTADTGYSSEENMAYLYEENINAVVPDQNFRQRDPLINQSETVEKHKAHRQLTRKDKAKGKKGFGSERFALNRDSKMCVCPNGYEMMYQGDDFEINNKRYMRFKSKLKNCRDCPLQSRCMSKPLKNDGRQVSFVVDSENNSNYLDLMKKRIDSEQGKQDYAKRMWVIEPVFANITSNKGINKLSLRGQAKVTCQWMMCCIVHNIEKLWRYGEYA